MTNGFFYQRKYHFPPFLKLITFHVENYLAKYDTLERKTCPHDCYDKSFIIQLHNYINMQTNSLVLRVTLQSTAMEAFTMKVINGIFNRLKYFCESLLQNYA